MSDAEGTQRPAQHLSSSVAVSRINVQVPSVAPEGEQTVANKHEHACTGGTRRSGTMMVGYALFTALLIPISCVLSTGPPPRNFDRVPGTKFS